MKNLKTLLITLSVIFSLNAIAGVNITQIDVNTLPDKAKKKYEHHLAINPNIFVSAVSVTENNSDMSYVILDDNQTSEYWGDAQNNSRKDKLTLGRNIDNETLSISIKKSKISGYFFLNGVEYSLSRSNIEGVAIILGYPPRIFTENTVDYLSLPMGCT